MSKLHFLWVTTLLLLCISVDLVSSSSVVVCRGSFAVRQSTCASLGSSAQDVIPSENLSCSLPGTPAQMAAFLRGTDKSWLNLDLSSVGGLQVSLRSMRVSSSPVRISFGSCNTANALPNLDADTTYLAMIVLDNVAAQSAVSLNILTEDTSTSVEMLSSVYYYDMNLLTNPGFTNALAGDLAACPASDHYCTLAFNSMVVSKQALVVMDSYLPAGAQQRM